LYEEDSVSSRREETRGGKSTAHLSRGGKKNVGVPPSKGKAAGFGGKKALRNWWSHFRREGGNADDW